MSRSRQMIQGGVLSGGSVLCSLMAVLLVGKLATTHLPQHEVAVFALLLLSADFFNLLSNFGLSAAFPKLVAAATPEEKRSIIHSSMWGQVFVSLCLTVVLLAAVHWIPVQRYFSDEKWLRMLPYVGLLPPLFMTGVLRDLSMAALAGLNRYGYRASGVLLQAVSQVAFVGLIFLLGKGSVATLTGSILAAYAVAVLFLLFGLRDMRSTSFQWQLFRRNILFSMPLYANSMIGFFLQRFDTVLVLALLDAPSAAIYEMAKRLPVVFSRVMGALLVPFLPNISELIAAGECTKASALISQTFSFIAVLGYTGIFAVVVIQEFILVLIFSPEYLPATRILAILLGATCLLVQSGIMGQSLIALGRPRYIVWVNLFLAVCGVVLNTLLIPHFGMLGAALVALSIAASSCFLQAFYTHRLGIVLDKKRCILPTLFFLILGAPVLLSQFALAMRIAALFLFLVLSLGFGVIHPRQVRGIFTRLIPARMLKARS